MLVLMFVSCLWPSEGDGWVLDDLEVFQPLTRTNALVAPWGDIYIADRQETRVLRFNAGGEFLNEFVSKGEGPGEAQFLASIVVVGDQLFVGGMGKTHIFKPDGTYVRTVKLAETRLSLDKVFGGWLITKFSFTPPGEEPEDSVVWFADENLENRQELVRWKSSPMVFVPGQKIKYNPASERYLSAYSDDRKRLFIRLPGATQIQIFSGVTGKKVTVFDFEDPKTPFNDDWGKKQLEEQQARFNRSGGNFKLTADFPDYFPAVSALRYTPEELLGIYQEVGRDGAYGKVLFLDQNGKPAKSAYGPFLSKFILAIKDGMAIVGGFSLENDNGLISKRPVTGLKVYLEQVQADYRAWRKENY